MFTSVTIIYYTQNRLCCSKNIGVSIFQISRQFHFRKVIDGFGFRWFGDSFFSAACSGTWVTGLGSMWSVGSSALFSAGWLYCTPCGGLSPPSTFNLHLPVHEYGPRTHGYRQST